MFRRSFIRRITLASAGAGVAAVTAVQAGQHNTVTYRVNGFTCPTCAVGLDTMLLQLKGVVRSRSSYPNARTEIEFNPDLVTEKSLQAFIAEMGFTVEEESKH